VKPKDFPYITPLDPYAERPALPNLDGVYATPTPGPAKASEKTVIVRTALTIEPRDGFLYVFMPPLARLEDYLELVAHLEVAAQGVPVRIEGYPPPDDVRMGVLKVTPDPGVIEVNVQRPRTGARR